MSNEAPTDALRLDEAQRTAIEHAAMDANADVWRHCRLAMVADGEIVGYPCFSRADMAELARLYEAAPASPLPGGGDTMTAGERAFTAWASTSRADGTPLMWTWGEMPDEQKRRWDRIAAAVLGSQLKPKPTGEAK